MLPELVHPIFYRSGRLSDELRSHICPLGDVDKFKSSFEFHSFHGAC